MTLCIAWTKEAGPEKRLVMATDSMLTGAAEYPHGTKLMTFARGDCALCWEGDTYFVHSFMDSVRVDIDFSDRLSTRTTPLFVVKNRIVKIFNQLWKAHLEDRSSNLRDASFSFVFGGYCPEYQHLRVWHIRQNEQRTLFSAQPRTPSTRKPCFIGSGAGAAKAILQNNSNMSPFKVLLQVIDDWKETAVGGIPQVVIIGSSGAEIVGFVKDGERYFQGRKLESVGHKNRIRFISYDSNEL